ncbi:pimeloyl-ACP methyl ester esterase BioH [Vibrio penaeicida]|uniref:Pimeloyl-[acyl-carrier protein] methyl ester esterase n=1 Tax=Vibrio penaeicida TaxID=104609 RepID=A0AAV5NRM6_9VIBR|nr:pimeloyl-ACP methyl ester esterase BioH [Vibrio penaeicida]RTZ24679.1 pimeloyl-[acyl-carrier protein] methyl ester esterase [Vibrio penaeicida]GLQ73153.1 pimeloyl-[acyl-carrier protein] methyl ester esterase [Vibrio penaeicida]
MTTSLYWQSFGQGPDLILLHGWGMNGAVWQQTAERLARHFSVHVVDLPGYGHSHQVHAKNLETIAESILQDAPEKAIWVGWSLGGLVATHIALKHSERVTKLITVASSPKFAAEKPWRGIQPNVLTLFTEQLVEDFQQTVERFMALQAMGSPSARQDVKQLKQAVLSRPLPDPKVLLAGLDMLANIDLRSDVAEIKVPYLRVYGRLDGLVPIKVAKDMQTWAPNSHQHTFEQSSHAPFMTELELFCEKITDFCK